MALRRGRACLAHRPGGRGDGVAVDVAVRRGEIAAEDWTAARTRVAMFDKLAERHEALVRAEEDRTEQQLLDEVASRRRGEPIEPTEQEDR